MINPPQRSAHDAELPRQRAAADALAQGTLTYAPAVSRTHTISGILTIGPAAGTAVSTAGRITAITQSGDQLDLTITDGSTANLCVPLRLTTEPRWAATLRTGDVVWCTGVIRAGTPPSVDVGHLEILSKAYHALSLSSGADTYGRAQQRLADLLHNPRQRQLLIDRAALARTIRTTLADSNYLEIDTPILQTAPKAGSSALSVQLQAVGAQVALRPAPALLKYMIAGGFDRVFELYRTFRDEAIDDTHVVEYSLIEAYCAYADYHAMKPLAQQLIRQSALRLHGSLIIQAPSGHIVDLGADWPTITVHDAIAQRTASLYDPGTSQADALALAERHGISMPAGATADDITLRLYDQLVEPHTIDPVFYTDFPASTSVMARQHRKTNGLAEKWDLVVDGREIGSAYTELVDPAEQRRRLAQQSASAYESTFIDAEYLRVLEAGFPPCAGLVLGFERLLMTLTGTVSIHDAIPFPMITTGHDSLRRA